MAKEISDTVFDEALSYIATCTECEIRTVADAILIDGIVLDAGNFTGPQNGTPSGREIVCLVNDADDMLAIDVDSAGDIKRIALKLAGTDHVVTELTSAVTVGADDQINLGTFTVVFPDPT